MRDNESLMIGYKLRSGSGSPGLIVGLSMSVSL